MIRGHRHERKVILEWDKEYKPEILELVQDTSERYYYKEKMV